MTCECTIVRGVDDDKPCGRKATHSASAGDSSSWLMCRRCAAQWDDDEWGPLTLTKLAAEAPGNAPKEPE